MSIEGSSVWPVPLQRYEREGGLCFGSNGPHAFAWLAVPFGLILSLIGVVAIVSQPGAFSLLVGGGSIAIGATALYSTAYGAWGTLELRHAETSWTVATRLGRRARSLSFQQRDILSVEIYTPPPANVIWPGAAGRQLRIEIYRRERPVFLGAGLLLPPEVLQCLHDLLAPRESSPS